MEESNTQNEEQISSDADNPHSPDLRDNSGNIIDKNTIDLTNTDSDKQNIPTSDTGTPDNTDTDEQNTGISNTNTPDDTDTPYINTDAHEPSTDAEGKAEEKAERSGEETTSPQQKTLVPRSPEDEERINKYKKFRKVDGAAYKRVNQFLRKHTYITAREWAIARLCADFSTRGGAEMTFIGDNLPELIPFMTDTYSPQAVNQARNSFKRKVRKSGATFFYGALCGFFTADELDDILFESSEVARFLLEIEGTSIDIDDEIDIEDRISDVMRSVAKAASRIRQTKQEESKTENTDTKTGEDKK
ncbi:MAG: DUF5806 family protein [Euryarchaeota archaeon]|nr:DUF5806 family protein [Euryarchaeota archaeon]